MNPKVLDINPRKSIYRKEMKRNPGKVGKTTKSLGKIKKNLSMSPGTTFPKIPLLKTKTRIANINNLLIGKNKEKNKFPYKKC